MNTWRGVGFGAAATALAISGVVFGAAMVEALRVEDVSALPGVSAGVPFGLETSEAGSGEREPFSSYPDVVYGELLDAVNQDFFQPDRRPPPERYILPGERMAFVSESNDNRRQRQPDLRIVGVAIAGDVSLALVQVDDSLPFAVWLGEEVEGYRLAAVTEERVTLAGLNEEFTYPVVEQLRSGGGRARGRDPVAETAQALNERVREAVQRMGRGQGRGGEGGVYLPTNMRILTNRPSGNEPPRGGRPGGDGRDLP